MVPSGMCVRGRRGLRCDGGLSVELGLQGTGVGQVPGDLQLPSPMLVPHLNAADYYIILRVSREGYDDRGWRKGVERERLIVVMIKLLIMIGDRCLDQ